MSLFSGRCGLAWRAGRRERGGAIPGDRFIGWKPPEPYDRLHFVASNTRLLLVPEPGAFPNLGSNFVGGKLRRLSDDWRAKFGHPLELAEAWTTDRYAMS